MNIDLHSHAKWSKSTDFSYEYYKTMMQEAKRAGLDAVALTEHFDTINFREIYTSLDIECGSQSDFYEIEGVRVYPGIEVDVAEGGHILLIGTRSAIMDISCILDGWMEQEHYMGLKQLLDLADQHSCLKIGAHPYRTKNPLFHVGPELLSRLDALDLNGRDLHHEGRQTERLVCELGQRIGLPVVAGSDTHMPPQFGSVWNQWEGNVPLPDTARQLQSLLRSGIHSWRISPELDRNVGRADQLSALYKSRLATS